MSIHTPRLPNVEDVRAAEERLLAEFRQYNQQLEDHVVAFDSEMLNIRLSLTQKAQITLRQKIGALDRRINALARSRRFFSTPLDPQEEVMQAMEDEERELWRNATDDVIYQND